MSAIRKSDTDTTKGKTMSGRTPRCDSPYPISILQKIAISAMSVQAVCGMRFNQAASVKPWLLTQLKGSRGAGGSCLTYVIDGVPTPMQGDFNDYMHPDEVAAVEVYQSSEAPAQFQATGQSDCAVVVIWTKTRVGG